MNVEIGTEAPVFLFWEYLFQIFGILSLKCMENVQIRVLKLLAYFIMLDLDRLE